MENLRYINVVPTISNKSDGVGKFVRVFHQALMNEGISTHIFSQDANDRQFFDNVDAFQSLRLTGRLRLSFKLVNAVKYQTKENPLTIFHLHGIWMWVNLFPFFVRDINYIYSPHGAISPATVSNWSMLKRILFKYCQLRVINASLFVHATSELEKRWLIDFGVSRHLIAVIPLCDEFPIDASIKARVDEVADKNFIFVGRLAEIKNLPNLISAFCKVTKKYADAKLEIIGPIDSEYALRLTSLTENSKIVFLGELSQRDIRNKLRTANYFILPSFSENFSYSALEACYSGCCLVVSENTPWVELAPSFVAATFSPHNPKSIEHALLECCDNTSRTFDRNDLTKFGTARCVENIKKELVKCKIL